MKGSIDKSGLAVEKAKLLHALEYAGVLPPPAIPENVLRGLFNIANASQSKIAEINAPAGLTVPQPSDADVDRHLDAVLRASGSALRHYSITKTLADMRAAMMPAAQPVPQQ